MLDAAGSAAGAFAAHGVRRGDVVLTLVGNGIDYAATMLGCLRLGAAMLPCSEQLRPKDIALRLAAPGRRSIVTHERNADTVAAAAPDCPVLTVPDPALLTGHDPPPYADLDDLDPAFVLFTSGTSGAPKLVTHGQRYVWGQQVQSRHWLGAEPGELVWSTAAPGWSKSARNAFLAPWWCGAVALLQDRPLRPGRAAGDDPRRAGERAVHGADRVPPHRGARPDRECPVATTDRHGRRGAGRARRRAWQRADRTTDRGRVRPDRDRARERRPPGETAPPGSMGRPLPGVHAEIVDGELCVDPATVPTFFLGYDGEPAPAGLWHTGDLVRQDDDGWLFFESRNDDVILSAGYRIGPTEVESTLLGHPAVREAAVIGVPDDARGEIVAAFVVLRDPSTASDDLARDLQDHVKARPRRTSTRVASSSSPSCRRPPAARSPGPSYGSVCVVSSCSITIATASSSLRPTTASATAFTAGCALATA